MNEFKLDFLCVGFPKCGTSSLHSTLMRTREVELPYNKKETCFFAWYNNYPDPLDMFQKRYFPNALTEEHKLIRGAVEPSFIRNAEEIRQYFGSDVKLVFMLRNPAYAQWSLFKMDLRRVRSPKISNLYKKTNNDLQLMFRYYMSDFVKKSGSDSVFFYDYWLDTFLRVFPREQMHFILFEDYLQNYADVMDKLAAFLGVQISQLPDLWRKNAGDKISKDYRSAEINRLLYTISIHARKSGTNQEVFWNQKVGRKVQRYTLKQIHEPMSEENRRMALDYYRDSILRTAEITGLPLEERWLNA